MKPVAFEYQMADSAKEAAQVAAKPQSGAKFIAGGQSLGPMLNLRLARPQRLLDLTKASDLARIERSGDSIRIGAGVSHARIEDGEGPDGLPPLLPYVARGIAYRAVRNRGTVGGSLAHADPAADWIATMTVLNAKVEAVSYDNRQRLRSRQIAMADFMLGGFRTALGADELIAAVEVPAWSGGERWGYYKICRKVGEFADAIGAVVIDPRRSYACVVAGATGGAPIILDELAFELARTARPLPDPRVRDAVAAGLAGFGDDVKLQKLVVALQRAISKVLPQ
ncbi:FAD binding domain-containing protein [Dongia sp.]|uniref:FAD binding domain-containing protein n=1 Tax=Dongia sp. TaxID=1977262 RepID=UPI0037521C6B